MTTQHVKQGPTDSEWNEIRKAVSCLGKRRVSGLLPPHASSLDKTKYDLCRRLLIYMRKNNLTQRELAKQLGVVESRISEVLNYRVQKVTLDRLVKYHEILNPKFSLKVA